MAIARTPAGTNQGKPVGTLSVTTTVDIATGDTYLALVASDAGVSTTDWTEDVKATNAGNVIVQILRQTAISNLPSGSLIGVTAVNSGDAVAAAIVKITGLAASPKDGSSTGTGNGTSPSSGATGTLAQADEICIGAIGTEGPPTDAAGTWSNSFNAGQRDGTDTAGATSNVTISEGYLIVSATTAQTAAKTGIQSRDWAAAIATYKGFIPPPFDPILQAVKRSNFY